MGSSIGSYLHLTIFGQSHAPAVGMTLEGLPAGLQLDMAALQAFLARRAPGKAAWTTARAEQDIPEFLSGLVGQTTCGAPLTAILRNRDCRPQDYTAITAVPRPAHADFTAQCRYGGAQDTRGGGHFSGRLTAPLCIAGGVCLQILAQQGITVLSRIAGIGSVQDEGELSEPTGQKVFPTVSDVCGLAMQQAMTDARQAGDSLGGVVECKVLGLPAGLGDPMFDGMENRIAAAVFGIPAVKGIEFGDGFAAARSTGSRNNDAYILQAGKIVTPTNHCGGILGGMTNGMPLVFRVAFKPTPSIALPQQSVNMHTMQPVTLSVPGRHDACIVPRAVPCVEAAAAFAVLDAWYTFRATASPAQEAACP